MQKLVTELKSNIAHIVKGGGQKAIERHTSRGERPNAGLKGNLSDRVLQ